MNSREGWVRALVRFSRPHTILGTTFSVVGLFVLAWALEGRGGASSTEWIALALAWTACILANVYIVGLNQLTDVDIDRINKPDLPVASGRFSIRTARTIVAGCLVGGLLLAAIGGRWLFLTVLISCALGTVYSVPPVRLKRFHFWAAFCILAVRGIVVNLLLYLHFAVQIGAEATLPPAIWLLAAFVFGVAVVIAWFKDLPDEVGDRRFGVRTLTIAIGPRTVFGLGIGLLAASYAGVLVASVVGVPGLNATVLGVAHGVLLVCVLAVAWRTKLSDRAAVRRFYLGIWALFIAAYVIFPAAALLS